VCAYDAVMTCIQHDMPDHAIARWVEAANNGGEVRRASLLQGWEGVNVGAQQITVQVVLPVMFLVRPGHKRCISCGESSRSCRTEGKVATRISGAHELLDWSYRSSALLRPRAGIRSALKQRCTYTRVPDDEHALSVAS
jgi:hypothetical protein